MNSRTNEQTPPSSVLNEIDSEFDYLMNFEDITVSFLYRIDGLNLSTHFSKQPTVNLLPIITWTKSVIGKISSELSTGFSSIKYSNQGQCIYFYRAGKTAILVAILSPYANLGLMEMEINRVATRVGKIIDMDM